MQELNSIVETANNTGLEFFSEPLTTLFGDQLGSIEVMDFFSVENDENGTLIHSYSVVLAVKETIMLTIPGLETIRLGVVRDSLDEWPLIYVEINMGPANQSLSIKHFPLRIEIDNPYLKPVQLAGEQAILDGFSLEIEGSFELKNSDQLTIAASLETFSIPPFEIVGIGVVLALTDCRLITRDDDVDSAITDLGFNQNFRGLHAPSALMHWNLPVQFNEDDLPGIRAQLENIALGNQGISVNASLSWPVAFENAQFDVTETKMLLGFFVDPAWTFALASLTVGIRANVPNAIGAAGHVRIPFLDAIFGLSFSINYAAEDEYETKSRLSLDNGETVTIPLGAAQVTLSELNISARIDAEDEFDFEGSTSYTINDLPGLTVNVTTAILKLEHRAMGDTYRLQVAQVEIENIGIIDESELVIVTRREDDNTIALDSFEWVTTVIWSDIANKVFLSEVPDQFPLPPDDARLTLTARWEDEDGEMKMKLSLKAELENVDSLWRFIPADQRPEVAKASIDIDLTLEANEDNVQFTGELGLGLRLKLPDINQLSGMENLLQIDTGDAQGWIDLKFKAELNTAGNDTTGKLSGTLERPLSLAFNLPGLVLPAPPLAVSISEISLELSAEEEQNEGEFQLKGGFVLQPILPSNLGGLVPSSMAVHLESLLAIAQLYDLVGTVDLTLGVSTAGAYCDLKCEFDNVELEIDLFDMLAGVTTQLQGVSGGQAAEIDLDIDVSLQLSALNLSIGQLPSAQANDTPLPFSFGMTTKLGFVGELVDMNFELSNESFSFGIAELPIPIALPKLPLSRQDLDSLRDTNERWDVNIWNNSIEPGIDAELSTDATDLEQARSDLDALKSSLHDGDASYAQQLFELEFRTIPALKKSIFYNTGKKFLTEAVIAIYQILGERSTAASQDRYQDMVELYQDAVDLTLGSLQFDSGLQFVISKAKFVLPFNDPSDISVEGGASLRGFAPDSPLKPLEALAFTLGISSDAIYFSVEGGADPIPLPDFGRYPGNAVIFDRLIIGYGYSKNSLLIDFSGELELSPELIADVDTSSRLGIGLQLPNNSRLKFKLDLIPISFGKVNFLLPLIAFDINLRSENPPLAPLSYNCEPAWDGLQLKVPGVLRADFKRLQFSPFFGPLPAPNMLLAYDVDVGNKQFGFTFICDNYQLITPLLGQYPIPFLADNVPFFDQYCINLRLAGFGINFELRRPFPAPNPLLVFELMSFISDPSLPIDPAGDLANLMSAELRNARITLPPAVLGMFPELGPMLTRELNVRINVNTVIVLAQQLVGLVEDLQQRLSQASTAAIDSRQQSGLMQSSSLMSPALQNFSSALSKPTKKLTSGPLDITDLIDDLVQNPPPVLISELLNQLPRELRRLELKGSFIGFDANAVLLLISPDALHKQRLPTTPSPTPPPSTPGFRWVNVVTDEFLDDTALSAWATVNYGLKRGQLGDWSISKNSLLQKNNVGDNSPARYGAMLIRKGDPQSEFRLSVDLQSADNDGIGVLFYVQGKDSFYRFRMTSEQKQWSLIRLKKGVGKKLYTSSTAFQLGEVYRVRIEARSIPQESGDLPRRLDPRPMDWENIIPPLANKKSKPRFTTHIRIWINDALWCDVSDTDNPLTKGQVGLDSWWNNGARFDNFKLDRGEGLASNVIAPTTQALLPLISGLDDVIAETTDNAHWLIDDLAGFNDEDILQAIPASDSSAIVVAAQVKIFDQQSFRFLGVIQTDGQFNLLAAASVDSLTLSVAGIEQSFPLTINGRMRLAGRSAGVDSWAQFSAELYGEWNVIPADDSLAKIIIGNASNPVGIVVDSRQGFQLQGNGELQLFANQLRIIGNVDISDQHALVSGTLAFTPELNISTHLPVLELTMSAAGSVGPGDHFSLTGNGDLRLLGKEFSTVFGELSPDRLMLETRLDADNSTWSIQGFELSNAEMRLRGEIKFGDALPDILFQGSGRLRIADVQIDGDCYISANAQKWCLGASGRVNWQGQDWLQGAIELCNDQLTVQGQAQFTLNLTLPPSDQPANIQTAGLVLTAAVGGSFSLRSSGQLAACNFTLDWTLAIKLPDFQDEQSLPIATQRISINKANIPGNSNEVDLVDLINIDGLTLFSLGDVTIPVPTVSGTTDIYLHNSVSIDPSPVTFPIPLLTNEDTVNGVPTDPVPFIPRLYSYTPSVDIPAFNLPIPVLSTEPPPNSSDSNPLLSIPNILDEDQEIPIGEVRLNDLKLNLKLQWKDEELGIWMKAGNNAGRFITFDRFIPPPLINYTTAQSNAGNPNSQTIATQKAQADEA